MCFQIKSHGNINCNIKLSYKTVYNPNLIETMKLTVFFLYFVSSQTARNRIKQVELTQICAEYSVSTEA